MIASIARASVAIVGLALPAHGGDDRANRSAHTGPWVSLMASEVRNGALGDLKVIASAEHLIPGAGKRSEWEIRTVAGRRVAGRSHSEHTDDEHERA